MVVILETRVEKRKKLKRQKRISHLKLLIILGTCVILCLGIKLVNDYIVYLGYMDNPTIFNLDIREGRFELFGERYMIDLRILKKIH